MIIHLRQMDQVIVDRNLGFLIQLCDANYLHSVILATAKWSRVYDDAVQREKSWSGMLRRWIDYNRESAKQIVNKILASKRDTDDILRIQKGGSGCK